MKLYLEFGENVKRFDAGFSEDTKEFTANVGNFVTVHDGQNGATFYPSVSEEGVISWTNDRELENPQPVNIRGKSAYESALDNGFEGTEEEWIESFRGVNFTTDETLLLENGVLRVNTVDAALKSDVRPITSQGVYGEFAVINALLKLI